MNLRGSFFYIGITLYNTATPDRKEVKVVVLSKYAKLFLISFAYYCEVSEAASALCTECSIEYGETAVAVAILIGNVANQMLK